MTGGAESARKPSAGGRVRSRLRRSLKRGAAMAGAPAGAGFARKAATRGGVQECNIHFM
ncbi:hypothetical protein [Desulfatiglans anilini]|uniref:hypothetical protein n=1 Tax=Desulfatiglans anilini TaxID=90728 RepID=UPI00041B9257|nr:hypothetical protein [Desulfatiglans anilini]